MQIIDFGSPSLVPAKQPKVFLEIATATLVFIVPVLLLFLML